VNEDATAQGKSLFTNAAFYNSIEDPMLGGVSDAADGGLDPRPQAGSPAYTLVANGAPVTVTYRGAFSGPTDNWADGWSALSSLGYLKPAPPAAPDVSIARVGDSVEISWPSAPGQTYQLQSKSPITAPWSDAGTPVAGDGTAQILSVVPSRSEEYFRLVIQ
jgi:hypothetical protein